MHVIPAGLPLFLSFFVVYFFNTKCMVELLSLEEAVGSGEVDSTVFSIAAESLFVSTNMNMDMSVIFKRKCKWIGNNET